MVEAIKKLSHLWDEIIADFLEGRPSNTRPELAPYFSTYRRVGDIRLDAFPEPYLGRLDRRPHMAFLSLNPGQVVPDFQLLDHRGVPGVFVQELIGLGSYKAWAASWPYLREPWRTKVRGSKDHHGERLKFMRDWYGDYSLVSDNRTDFELYAWHSHSFSGASMRLDLRVLKTFVLDPLWELDPPWVFAFGAWWWGHLQDLGLEVIARLGHRGDEPFDIGYKPGAKQGVTVARTPNGGLMVAEKHGGPSPTPPITLRVPAFRQLILRTLGVDHLSDLTTS